MPRARRTWTTMLAEIRVLLREETAATSYWSDAVLLALFNQQMDLRFMELAEAHEGWLTDAYTANLVADQADYLLPEGHGRVKQIVLRYDVGAATEHESAPLPRDEEWYTGRRMRSASSFSYTSYSPSYKLIGDLLRLSPAPPASVTAGLKIEMEYFPARLTTGSDKLDWKLPDAMETLLILDTAGAALAIESSQGDGGEGGAAYTGQNSSYGTIANDIHSMRAQYAARFFEYVQVRSFGIARSTPLNLGD